MGPVPDTVPDSVKVMEEVEEGHWDEDTLGLVETEVDRVSNVEKVGVLAEEAVPPKRSPLPPLLGVPPHSLSEGVAVEQSVRERVGEREGGEDGVELGMDPDTVGDWVPPRGESEGEEVGDWEGRVVEDTLTVTLGERVGLRVKVVEVVGVTRAGVRDSVPGALEREVESVEVGEREGRVERVERMEKVDRVEMVALVEGEWEEEGVRLSRKLRVGMATVGEPEMEGLMDTLLSIEGVKEALKEAWRVGGSEGMAEEVSVDVEDLLTELEGRGLMDTLEEGEGEGEREVLALSLLAAVGEMVGRVDAEREESAVGDGDIWADTLGEREEEGEPEPPVAV
jgi:hypothetical protein